MLVDRPAVHLPLWSVDLKGVSQAAETGGHTKDRLLRKAGLVKSATVDVDQDQGPDSAANAVLQSPRSTEYRRSDSVMVM